eukprot:gnl/MRDRNA2_/MRDRNA2_97421_c0_seq1.p1 gnl/MRDRNA2_/MRDRNA2_97421_c0~~gnl/MRDRNA2_/MRDRNA2_97421_c0_seq1.p1  ORF type:complete len:244 (+),score=67.58 gnl/MRDRNA2_/MRDRNA2_97421_c0_seq1:73-804(+)
MSKPFDYSKWDRLEISDDEDDFHPNIDNALMIRLKREQRAKREAEEEAEKRRLASLGTSDAKAEIETLEKKKKLNVGNICQVVDDKTVVSKKAQEPPIKAAPQSESEQAQNLDDFRTNHHDVLVGFAEINSLDDTERYLIDNGRLILTDDAANALLLLMLQLEMGGENSKMRQATKQYLMLRNILDLAEQGKRDDPRSVVRPFFKQLQDKGRVDKLDKEANVFATQIEERAVDKLKEMEAMST